MTFFLPLEASTAFASGSLSTLVLTTSLPGLIRSSPGADNGPINASNINTLFGGDTAAQQAQLSQQLSNGQLSGFVRLWRSQSPGDGLVLLAFQTQQAYTLATLLGGYEKAASAQVTEFHGSKFNVPGVADSQGFEDYVTNVSTPFRQYVVAFARGNTAFFLTLVTTSNNLTKADAITVAQRQWAKAPGIAVAPDTPPSLGEDLLIGVVAALVVALIGIIWQRTRTRRRISDNPTSDVVGYASYKQLAKDQRRIVRKALVKTTSLEDNRLNEAALEWANHNIVVYWIALASFVTLSVTVAIVSQGHVVIVSLFAIISLIGVLNMRMKRSRFIEMRSNYATPIPQEVKPLT
jgi:hypothetical protein